MIFKNSLKLIWNHKRSIERKVSISATMQLKLDPSLKGMKELDRDKFQLELSVPAIKVRKTDFGRVKKILHSFTTESLNKKYQNLDENDPLYSTHKYMLLDPDLFDFANLDTSIKDELIKTLNQDQVRMLEYW